MSIAAAFALCYHYVLKQCIVVLAADAIIEWLFVDLCLAIVLWENRRILNYVKLLSAI